MIAKRVARKNKSSSFKKCADYITDQSHNGRKTLNVSITNCMTNDYNLSIKEVLATQAMNTRTKNDKTYHLVISFPNGEAPNNEQLIDIERTFCKRLGFGDHQSISAVHNDTDNLHIHIAINKINPTTFNIIEPYYDHYKLNEICEELELKHGLHKDNRIKKSQDKSLSSKPSEIESHSSIITFESWIKSLALPDIKEEINKTNSTWASLHDVLSEYDLTIRQRGAGFVISHAKEKVFVKSSSIWRPLSKFQLEKKLGKFIPPNRSNQKKVKASYRVEPLQNNNKIAFRRSRDKLYESYQKERNETIKIKRDMLNEVKEKKMSALSDIKKQYESQRHDTKISRDILHQDKKSRYMQLRYWKIKALADVNLIANKERAAIHEKYELKAWQDFLVKRADDGCKESLTILRYKKKPPSRDQDGLSSENGKNTTSGIYHNLNSKVTKTGEVVYTLMNKEKIKDTGQQITVHDWGDQTAMTALQMAKVSYGDFLHVSGSDMFKATIVRLAVEHHESIRFDDKELEATRLSLLKKQDHYDKKVEVTKGVCL